MYTLFVVLMRKIYHTGILLQTIYQTGSLFKLFVKGVCFCRGVAESNGEIPVPPSPMARSWLTWRACMGAAITNGETADVEGVSLLPLARHAT